MTDFLTHGRIIGGVVTTPDLDLALEDYHGTLGLNIVERGELAEDLAASWNCPASAGARTATLQPQSGAHCFIRLVEQPVPDDFKPTRTYGWAAYELSVQDVYGWPDRLAGSGFDIIGPPKELTGLPYFVPMQVTGRGREMIYLNEVRENTPSTDLPKANALTDHIFICILATPDRAANLAWYKERLGLDEAGTYTLAYTMINKAFALADGTQSTITMLQKGRLPILEVDDYPQAATARPCAAGCLPPGNALVTLAVDRLDAVNADFIQSPAVRGGAIYAGKRSATVIGMGGELLELVEIGSANK
jgi:catechol 2,3-dioxygenase-like lactoylglutathione lyase family enzyme